MHSGVIAARRDQAMARILAALQTAALAGQDAPPFELPTAKDPEVNRLVQLEAVAGLLEQLVAARVVDTPEPEAPARRGKVKAG